MIRSYVQQKLREKKKLQPEPLVTSIIDKQRSTSSSHIHDWSCSPRPRKTNENNNYIQEDLANHR
jgi:hypothetical protein